MSNIDKYQELCNRLKSLNGKDRNNSLEKYYLMNDIQSLRKEIQDKISEGYARQERVKCALNSIGFKASNKAIFRIETEKTINSFDDLESFDRHSSRSIKTPNANIELTQFNVILKGEKSAAMTVEDYYIKYNLKPQKSGRLCTELLYTMSPGAFLKPGSEELDFVVIEKWCNTVMEYLEAEFPDNQLVWAKLDLDESTPHVHALVVGRTYHSKLKKEVPSHTKFFGSRYKLRSLQTNYANALQRKGFVVNRGLIGSKATHKTVSRWRAEQQEKDNVIEEYKIMLKKKDREALNKINKIKEKEEIERRARNKVLKDLIKENELDIEDVVKRINDAKLELINEVKKEEKRSEELKNTFSLERKLEDDK